MLGAIRGDSETKITAAWATYAQGHIDRPRFLQLAAAILGQSGAKAATLADLAVATEMTRLRGRIFPSTGVDAAIKRPTYLTALQTVLDGDGDLLMQLGRLALNAPLQAAQTAYGDAIAASGARGWVRQLEADPCQLCRWWWREGRVWPTDHPMPTHPGCDCVARPVI